MGMMENSTTMIGTNLGLGWRTVRSFRASAAILSARRKKNNERGAKPGLESRDFGPRIFLLGFLRCSSSSAFLSMIRIRTIVLTGFLFSNGSLKIVCCANGVLLLDCCGKVESSSKFSCSSSWLACWRTQTSKRELKRKKKKKKKKKK